MMQPTRPRSAPRLPALAFCTLAVRLAWLLLGQQLAGHPAVHLDLAAGLPATSPGTSLARQHQTTPPRPRPPEPSTGTSPQPEPSTGTSTAARSAGTSTTAAGPAVGFALQQRGKPYLWGAEGPSAYDCSGLVWRAWQHAGLGWERMTAAGQWRWLHQHHHHDVPARQLRPGDLLCYARHPHDPASIHHVAIAIGHGRMVEAYAPSTPVRAVPIRWSGFYAAARPIP